MKVRLECTRARHSGASKVFRTVGSFAELGDGGRAKAQRGGRGGEYEPDHLEILPDYVIITN